MNKIIEFIKRIFRKNSYLLDEGNKENKEKNINQKQAFLKDIKVDSNLSNILGLQKKLENGAIEETNLYDTQIAELKELYCNQIANIVNSINKYKLRLNIN